MGCLELVLNNVHAENKDYEDCLLFLLKFNDVDHFTMGKTTILFPYIDKSSILFFEDMYNKGLKQHKKLKVIHLCIDIRKS
jgi:hypothetical protein